MVYIIPCCYWEQNTGSREKILRTVPYYSECPSSRPSTVPLGRPSSSLNRHVCHDSSWWNPSISWFNYTAFSCDFHGLHQYPISLATTWHVYIHQPWSRNEAGTAKDQLKISAPDPSCCKLGTLGEETLRYRLVNNSCILPSRRICAGV